VRSLKTSLALSRLFYLNFKPVIKVLILPPPGTDETNTFYNPL